jgi:hypothetical protein
MGVPIEGDADLSRRNRRLHLAGAALAVANVAIPAAMVSRVAALGPDTGLGLFRGGYALGWFIAFMFLFAAMHLAMIIGYLLVRLATRSRYSRGGTVTLALAGLPWVEWALFYVYMRSQGYN